MTLRIKVKGQEFPLDGLWTTPKVADLVAMKLNLDISLPELERRVARIDALPGGWTSLEIYEHPDLMEAKCAVAWLAQRNAGARVPIEEALTLSPMDIYLVGDQEDRGEQGADEDADPTEPASSDPDDVAAPKPSTARPASTGRKTKTSAPTS